MKSVLMVLMNAADGREPEFACWLDQHMIDMVGVDEFKRARRFVSSGPGPGTHRHLAVYELGEGRVQEAIASLQKAKDAGLVPVSDVLDPATCVMWFDPVAEFAGGQ